MGTLVRLKATGEQTWGGFSLVEELFPAGYATPLHIHHAEDEAFYVLEGEVTVFCGDQKLKAGPGTYVYEPRGIAHGFRAGNTPARLLILFTPSGFDQFFVEMGRPAKELVLPPAEHPDVEKIITLAAKHQTEVLGPLPE
jgi:quercetin dioxygenase-like cupin family protein